MPTDHRARLAGIRRFDQLIAYLRDEMDWPIARDSFDEVDDLFYDFTPEELGIDTKNAAKIQEIKRLRPLSVHQPWGIFFVKFEPKRLPVVALRRILSQVALKKRASANSAERAAWSADDLLFVSNYGEGDIRQITFAHFSQNEEKKDLPTLKVLGWDNLDTPLHLDHVAEPLTERLTWPNDDEDVAAWRKQWRSAFTLGHREVINTSKKLSIELAELARAIRDRINTVLAIETEDGPVSKLMAAFKEALVHDLDEDGFADMYAQTIAYGLLSARVANPSGGTADDIASVMPVTNPFLKELMEAFLDVGGRKGRARKGPGLDFDELGVSEVVELLDAANMEAVARDFGDKNPQEDPVIHFYELFLKEYDAKKRMQRGVFYTPRPVVSFIVRSVDELLRTEFGLADGLADTTTWGEMAERFDGLEIPEGASPDQAFVQILDPATGTGTFLVEVIDVIYRTMSDRWVKEGHLELEIPALWNDYVPKHLLPRLHGYELMMAPYAIAHMKIGLKLYETGYRFESNERARVYLTNSLEPPQDFSDTLAFAIPALAHEAEAVNAIKQDQRFTVVIGNPPYSISSCNNGEWITSIMNEYKEDVRIERNIQPLSDDYVKFVRFAHQLVIFSKVGIIGYITNHTFLSGLIHRGMRRCLLADLQNISVLDLHGSALLGLCSPDGREDKNVFDIQQGVAITLARRHISPDSSIRGQLLHGDLWGSRQHKYQVLDNKTCMGLIADILDPEPPNYFFVPSKPRDKVYDSWPSITVVFNSHSTGFETGRDEILIGFDKLAITSVCKELHSATLSYAAVKEKFGLRDTNGWPFQTRLTRFRSLPLSQAKGCVRRILYRPFDERFTIYTDLLRRAQIENQRHMMVPNLGLIASRMIKGEKPAHVYASRLPIEKILISPKTSNNAFLFPLYLCPNDGLFSQINIQGKRPEPNLGADFLASIAHALGTKKADSYVLPIDWKPEDIFYYVYSVLHSPEYRSRYAEFLKIDFPRIPLPGTLELFSALLCLGQEIVAMHLLESPKLDDHITTLVGSDECQVEKVSYSDETVWIDKAKTCGFRGVPEEVWNFHIGGYQVCNKWLKDRQAKGGKNPRPGRVLTDEDIDHYQKIVVALNETIRIMAEIDEVIEAHGGWPGAFQTGDAQTEEAQEDLPMAAEPEADYKSGQAKGKKKR